MRKSSGFKSGVVLATTLFLFGCLAQQERSQIPQVLAMVNGKSIKEDDLRYRLMLYQYPLDLSKDKAIFKSLKKEVLDEMIRRRAIIDWGAKNGITLNPQEQSQAITKAKRGYTEKEFDFMLEQKGASLATWSGMISETAAVEKILKESVYKKIQVKENEINSYYNKNIDSFKVGERAHVRQIVTDSKEKADLIRAKLLQGENFAQMAIQYSISPDRAQGGDLGYVAKGTFPKEFDETCFKLKRGEVSPVIKTAYGFHIFKLIDLKPKGVLELNEVLNRIQAELLKQKIVQTTEPWIEKVLKESVIQVREDTLEKMEL